MALGFMKGKPASSGKGENSQTKNNKDYPTSGGSGGCAHMGEHEARRREVMKACVSKVCRKGK